jgi:tripartite-type tricarboxylate transporter receptor subunit TctC
MPHIKTGRLRALAVSSARRQAMQPSVPTIAESGYPGFENTDWYGVVGPAGMPAAVIHRLNSEINKSLLAADVKERIAGLGAETGGGPPDQLANRIKSEVARWAKVIKQPVIDD